jgi:hypothetical protein
MLTLSLSNQHHILVTHMSDIILEFECRVPVDGYRIMVFDERKFVGVQLAHPESDDDFSVLVPPDATEDERYLLNHWGMRIVPVFDPELIAIGIEPEEREILVPRSERGFRRFDLFKAAPSPWVEFTDKPVLIDDSERCKQLADRFGLLGGTGPEYVDYWWLSIMELSQAATVWQKAKETGNFDSIIRFVSRRGKTTIQKSGRLDDRVEDRIDANILLRKEPSSGQARLFIRPTTLLDAVWTQLALSIDGSESLGKCSVCRKWFAIRSGKGRFDKEYCSAACKMRAYRKRKGKAGRRRISRP